MDISVIVPVYNVEKYIKRCLDSIFHQEFSGCFEVIAVDDASTDSSLKLLYSYQKIENRLRIIEHKTNKKLSIARSSGMKAAEGDYIMHIDADDWILPGALESLFAKCKRTGADVVEFGIVQKDDEGNSRLMNIIRQELLTDNKSKVKNYFVGSAVSKIVRRKITEELISSSVGVNSAEDLLYSFEVLLKAHTICLLPEVFYVYYKNTSSLTGTLKPEDYIQNQVVILKQIERIIEKHNPGIQLTDFILDYYEKWIYLMIAKLHFENRAAKSDFHNLIMSYNKFPNISRTRVDNLESAINNKMASLKEVAKRFSIRTALGVIYRYYFIKRDIGSK